MLLAVSVGNALGIRVEKNGQISDELKGAYKRVQLASAALVAGQHGGMKDLASMKRSVPSGPNSMVDSPHGFGQAMVDWGPVLVAVVLFVLMSPGLLFQIPGKSGQVVEFSNFHTSSASILVHAIIYFALITLFLIVIGVHVYAG
ncbi:hypothetical protein ZIOFF_061556 [Zingiber officinale]|uniref:Uncharacterized protein n=2 Tax=Zingiber officinale TaxID=94328 RepID=A0A8J5KEP7_ZINOF|nr:hypothetical protein ZIOFF_061556 [Zingiber officinale]